MHRYSKRLPWSFSPNKLHEAIQAKRAEGLPLLDLAVSNPTEALTDYPNEAIKRAYGNVQDFTYRPDPLGSARVREAISNLYKDRGFAVSPDDIVLTASTSEAYALLFKLFCDPEDEVLVPIPSYPLFEYLASLESVHLVPYSLTYDGRWFTDVPRSADRLSERTKAIVLVNPNNPTGSFLKKAEFDDWVRFAKQHNLPIVSDEVFMDFAIHPQADQLRTVAGDERTLSFALNGLSKMAGMPQVKLGWIVISGPPDERALARQRLELISDTYLSVNTPVQCAFEDLLEIGFELQNELRDRIISNVNTLETTLAGSPAHALYTEGGWSAVIQVPAVLSEEEWTLRLLEDRSVVVQPGYFFDMTAGAHLVVSLITPEDQFQIGVKAIDDIARSL